MRNLKSKLIFATVMTFSSWSLKTSYKETPKAKDFQAGEAKDSIFKLLKPNDGSAMIEFLSKKKNLLQQKF